MSIIKSLTLEGFKSFAKYTQLFFSPKFNVVLGPNGSGKSNITEAICFVLGRLSSKSLRAEHSASLIYNGGKTKQPAKKATVSIVFDNSKKVFPIEGEELKITRTVKSNGQSIYMINNKRVTRQQILEVLSYARIDPDGYNIVLQGDINKFINMSSIERREVVEEIAGIQSYEDKKQKSLNELERVDGRIKEAEIVLAERKTYLKELKKQYDQALKYKKMKENIERNKATFLYLQIQKKTKEKMSIEREIENTNKNINKIQDRIKEYKNQEEELKKRINEISETIEERGEKEQVQVQKEVEELKVNIAKEETDLKSSTNEIQRIMSRKEQLNKDIDEINDNIQSLNNEIKGLEQEKERINKEKEEVEKSIKAFESEHDINKITEIEKNLDNVEKEIEKKDEEIKGLIEKKQNLLREKDKKSIKIENIESQIQKLKIIEKEHKEELDSLKKQKQVFKETILELNKSLSYDSELAAKIMELKKQISNLREEIERVKIKTIRMEERISSNVAVKSILRNKDKFGRIYGIVSQLGNVSGEHSLALDVASGNRKNSIVVDNDKTATNCINYLKKEKLGIATFLPLNKIRKTEIKNDIRDLLKVRGVIGLASDLIKCDTKFKNVFSYVFGDTLVVDDLNVARRIGIGKARMVTLDGDLTEKSGAMHGGYRKKSRTSFQAENDIKEMESLEKREKELRKLESDEEKLDKDREENLKKINELRRKKGELEGDIIKREKSLHLDTSDLDANKREKTLLNEEIKKIDKELSKIEEQVSRSNESIVKLKISRQDLKKEISKLRNPVIVAELNAFEKKKTEFNNEIIRLDEKIKSKKERNENIKEEKEKTGKIIRQIIKEKEEFEKNIKTLKEKIKKEKEELEKKEKLQKEFYAKFKKLFEEKNSLNEKLQKVTNLILNKNDEIRRLEQKINNNSLKKATVSGELAGLEREFEDYKEVEILKNKEEAELKYEIKKFEKLLEEFGNINLKALDTYEEVQNEYNDLMKKKEKLTKEKDDVLKLIDEIDKKKKEIFVKTFELVNEHFKSFFLKLSTKGEAYLKLEDEEQPFNSGVLIRVRLTKEKFLDIRSLSGGEKTLTALALIFAIQEFQPASFYILDEVDAALDKKNSEKLAQLISEYSKKAQYIVISHNDSIISSGDTLFGVSMNKEGISKLISLKI